MLLTQNEKRNRSSLTRAIETHQATTSSFGWENHKYLSNGQSDISNKFNTLQIIGTVDQSVTVSYNSTSQKGQSASFIDEVLYVGDFVYGYELTNISVTAGDARVRAYYA